MLSVRLPMLKVIHFLRNVQVMRQTCLSPQFGMIGQSIPVADEAFPFINRTTTQPKTPCKPNSTRAHSQRAAAAPGHGGPDAAARAEGKPGSGLMSARTCNTLASSVALKEHLPGRCLGCAETVAQQPGRFLPI